MHWANVGTRMERNMTISKNRQTELRDYCKKLGFNLLACSNTSNAIDLINEALTHTSARQDINHERLEFLGDAVLRLAASEYIEISHPKMSVGERSFLRSQLVSDDWLGNLGGMIHIDDVQIIGAPARGDEAARSTLRAEATEALIGAIYQGWGSIRPIHDWLTPHWHATAERVLSTPNKYNSKTALQEWSQGQGLGLPHYATEECSRQHGDPERFRCQVSIQNRNLAEAKGRSRKEAEQNAAAAALQALEGNDAPQPSQ